jgi:hypothetical protein
LAIVFLGPLNSVPGFSRLISPNLSASVCRIL